MPCLLAVAAICLPWGQLNISVTDNSIARVATFKSPTGEVAIWLSSDNIPYGDWAHAPQVCIGAKCMTYRRIDRSNPGSAKTTLLFCRSDEALPERVEISAPTPNQRDRLLASMALKPPFDASKSLSLTAFSDTAAVGDSREERVRGDGACP
ncbi:MAG TPA: hypothetical protein VG939_18135 [Caulobacteraceae bacterium]|nr:hypothetical protein [Caulobacteraceae bacterium]